MTIHWMDRRLPRFVFAQLSRLGVRGFAGKVATVAVGTALGQVIPLLALPVLARLYTPEDFGALTVFVSTLTMVGVISSLRYELAIPLPRANAAAANVMMVALCTVGLTSTGFGVLLWTFDTAFVEWAGITEIEVYLWLLPAGALVAGVYNVLSYWAVRREAFGRIAKTKVAQGVGGACTQALGGVLWSGPLGLLIGQVVASASGVTTLARAAISEDHQSMLRIRPRRMRTMAIRYREFPIVSSSSALLNSAGVQLPPILIAGLFGAHVAGLFAVCQRIVGIPMGLFGRAVGQVFFAEACRSRAEGHDISELFRRTGLRLALISVGPFIIGLLGARPLVEHYFGPQWQEAAVYLQVMMFMFLLQFVMIPLSQTLIVIDRQRLQLAWDAGRLVLVIGVLTLAHSLRWPPARAIGAYSGAAALGYGAWLLLAWSALKDARRTSVGSSPAVGGSNYSVEAV